MSCFLASSCIAMTSTFVAYVLISFIHNLKGEGLLGWSWPLTIITGFFGLGQGYGYKGAKGGRLIGGDLSEAKSHSRSMTSNSALFSRGQCTRALPGVEISTSESRLAHPTPQHALQRTRSTPRLVLARLSN